MMLALAVGIMQLYINARAILVTGPRTLEEDPEADCSSWSSCVFASLSTGKEFYLPDKKLLTVIAFEIIAYVGWCVCLFIPGILQFVKTGRLALPWCEVIKFLGTFSALKLLGWIRVDALKGLWEELTVSWAWFQTTKQDVTLRHWLPLIGPLVMVIVKILLLPIFLIIGVNAAFLKMQSLDYHELAETGFIEAMVESFSNPLMMWSSNPWLHLFAVLNQFLSIVRTDDVKQEEYARFLFAGSDAFLQREEHDRYEKYVEHVHDRIWNCQNLSFFWKFCCSYNLDNRMMQRLMAKEDDDASRLPGTEDDEGTGNRNFASFPEDSWTKKRSAGLKLSPKVAIDS